MVLPRRDHGFHTYADYRTWPEDTRYELIDGRAFAMAPAPAIVHQELLGELFRQISDQLEGSHCRAFVAPVDVRLAKSDEGDDRVDTVVQPDLLVVCEPNKIDEQGIRGAPDWVIEILSPRTAGHDQVIKRAVYERHGVLEYWLVHPIDKVVTIYRLDAGAYGKPHVQELIGESRCEAVTGVTIDWARATRRI